MRARCPFRRFVLPATLTFLATAGLLRADIQNPPGRSSFPGDRRLARDTAAPPNGVSQTTAVREGGRVDILLRARGHNGEMIDFILRTPPAHGTLDGDPRQITLNSALVTYVHHPGDNVLADSFTYAVQTRDSALSAEVTVTVRIQEPAPVVTVSPAELDFGAVKAGENTRAELTLTNEGGGEASGRLDPPSPWVVDGDPTYRLPRGTTQKFALVFKPTGERAYTDALHFRYENGGGVRLIGTGLAGPGQARLAAGGPGTVTGTRAPLPGATGPGGDAVSILPSAEARTTSVPAASVTPARPMVTSLEPGITVAPGLSALPPAMMAVNSDSEIPGVNAIAVRERGRSTLDLAWRALIPAPRSYRVELRYLSLGEDDRLIVEWRPYALTTVQTAGGFVNAHLFGLEAGTQECIRVVAVDNAGQLTAPSPLVVTYTLPPATWYRPTTLKVLFALLLVCGGLAARQRWETHLILSEIDESRRRVHAV